jgi:hypothetical protein
MMRGVDDREARLEVKCRFQADPCRYASLVEAPKKILDKGVKVSAGTDATRVASYNPWVSLSWLVTGRTVAGLRITPQRNCLDREAALRMWTENVTWFSNEEGKKGRIAVGQFADLVVPDRDYFSCAEAEIADITSELTIVGGKIVYGASDFASLGKAAPPPAMPDWSPVRSFGGYGAWAGDLSHRPFFVDGT